MRKLRTAAIALVAMLLGPAGASAQTFKVDVGAPGKLPAHLDLSAFFPSALTIHEGDSVRFQINGFHDVAYLRPGMSPPALAIPVPGSRAGDVRDAAGAAFWFDAAPKLRVNPAVALPAGTHLLDPAAYANSGLPGRAKLSGAYELRFAQPGTYRLYCLVHRGMSVLVRVVPHSRQIPSRVEVQARAHAQLRAALRLARRLQHFRPPRLTVLAGHDAGAVSWMRFFPEHLHVRVGQTITFRVDSMMEPHTITFGPESYTGEIERTLTQLQPTAGAPPALMFNPLGAYPSEPPGAPLIYTGANHGNGFLNSGMLDTDPHTPNPSSVRITFTRPGTYHFECVVHPDMDGTVEVTR
jgi:plastocyanin